MKHLKKFDEINEGLGTIVVSVIVVLKLLRWIAKVFLNKVNRKVISDIKNKLSLLSAAKTMSKSGWINAVSITEWSDRYFIQSNSKMFKLDDIRVFKNEKSLVYCAQSGDIKIKLTDDEYAGFLKIIKDKI